MRELALHLLDIAENSIAAQAKTIRINVEEDLRGDRLCMQISDDGVGMDAETLMRVVDPFYTSRVTRKVGLGIPLLKEAAEACNGSLVITSEPGKGTTLKVDFQYSHIDRMPLGDLTGTILTLCITSPQVRWVLHYRVNADEFAFDTQPIKEELGDIPFSEPSVLAFLREYLEEGIRKIRPNPSGIVFNH